MSEKIRVYDLANELGLANKELLELLKKEGFNVRSHSSTLEAEEAELIRKAVLNERMEAQKAKNAPPPSPVAAEEPEAELEAEAEEEEDADGEANEVRLKTPVTVRDLASALDLKPNALIVQLMGFNIFAAINQVLDTEIVEKICEKNGKHFVQERREKGNRPVIARKPGADELLGLDGRQRKKAGRPPVVCFMGHVDHGKTTLQDYIRKTKVAAGEAGGITQGIGASIAQYGDQTITFLDTPGHAAFTAMRARGAVATDIVVLVVAAQEGIMPQTIEAIHHAQAAKVPIIVAMTKMDLPGADPDKVFRGLQENGVDPEDWGGQTAVIPVSGVTGEGVDDLLERILLEAEMLELQATPNAPFEGLVIEAQMESGMGPTANLLIRNGTLRQGDWFICGTTYGKARALLDTYGKRLARATPSMPVKVLGFNAVPEAGDKITWCDDERTAKEAAESATAAAQAEKLAPKARAMTLDDINAMFSSNAAAAAIPELKLILKCDVRGSLEAITEAINGIKSSKITAKVIHAGVGEITETDIILASASNAIVIGFHVRAMPGVNRVAKQRGVEIRLYSIIYDLLDDLQDAMRGRLPTETKEVQLGEAEIVQIFNISKTGKICGCRVNSGSVKVNLKAKVYREKELIYSGLVASLKHFKEDVKEMRAGQECGIRLDNFEDFEEGDKIQVFDVQKIAAEL